MQHGQRLRTVPIKAGGSSNLDVYKMYRLLPRQPGYAPQVPRAATDTGVEARPGLWRAGNGTACVLRVRRTRSPLPQPGGGAATAGRAAGTSTTRRAAGAAAATCARGAWLRAPATRAPPASRCRPRPCWPPRAPRRWPPRRRPRWAAQARPACAPTWCSRMPVKQPARGMLGGVLRLLMAQEPESLCVASRFTCAAAPAACRQLWKSGSAEGKGARQGSVGEHCMRRRPPRRCSRATARPSRTPTRRRRS